ncbi:MAG TPA: pilus assembly protein N-terminal domain-containing protein [Phenylobacterium sp.]
MRLVLTALAALVLATPALAEPMRINIDQSSRLRLSSPARDVLLGNPAVADVTMLDTRNLVILGKSYGTTHLLVIDTAGRTIVDRNLVVTAADEGQVSLYRGAAVTAFACAKTCEPSATGGKAAKSGGAAPAAGTP